MATYKVPQDVEAEDKIIGFLSLKQLIFVIIMFASLWMCWILAKVNIALGIIPLPIALISGLLGLYQRKDQPVEVYLASWLRFKTKPRRRKWDQEGLESRVIITAPKVTEKIYTKGLSEQQVESRLTQLSSLLDSRGWASKLVAPTQQETDGQRLFSMQELSRYAHPTIPLDAETDSVLDQYDDEDPRNRTAQEVDRDFTNVTKKQRERALATVEKARRETSVNKPVTQPVKTVELQSLQPQRSTIVSPVAPQKPKIATQNSTNTNKTSQIKSPQTTPADPSEVIIDLHKKR